MGTLGYVAARHRNHISYRTRGDANARRLALGHADKRRNQLHTDRIPDYGHRAFRGRQRAVHGRHRQRHQGMGSQEAGGHLRAAGPHGYSHVAAAVTRQHPAAFKRTRLHGSYMGCTAICPGRPTHQNIRRSPHRTGTQPAEGDVGREGREDRRGQRRLERGYLGSAYRQAFAQVAGTSRRSQRCALQPPRRSDV